MSVLVYRLLEELHQHATSKVDFHGFNWIDGGDDGLRIAICSHTNRDAYGNHDGDACGDSVDDADRYTDRNAHARPVCGR